MSWMPSGSSDRNCTGGSLYRICGQSLTLATYTGRPDSRDFSIVKNLIYQILQWPVDCWPFSAMPLRCT